MINRINQKNISRYCMTGITLVFITSCVSSGRDFSSRLEWIKKGKTKLDDVRLVLGEPQSVGSSDGVPSWTYGRYQFKLFGSSYTKEVKFYWNPDKTVQSWSFNSSFPDDVGGVAP